MLSSLQLRTSNSTLWCDSRQCMFCFTSNKSTEHLKSDDCWRQRLDQDLLNTSVSRGVVPPLYGNLGIAGSGIFLPPASTLSVNTHHHKNVKPNTSLFILNTWIYLEPKVNIHIEHSFSPKLTLLLDFEFREILSTFTSSDSEVPHAAISCLQVQSFFVHSIMPPQTGNSLYIYSWSA